MRFRLILTAQNGGGKLPINYQYPLSATIYRILSKGDREYARFLHEEGYGKGYKFFTFSDLKLKFKLEDGDRMRLLEDRAELYVHFHMPEASRNFIEGLFKSEEIVIADKKSKVTFSISTIMSMKNPFDSSISENELIQVLFKPLSAVLSGIKNDSGNYDYLAPDDARYSESLIRNWREKIKEAYDPITAEKAVLLAEIEYYQNPYRSRLVHIKEGTDAHTKIKGYINFKLKLTAEKRFIELIYNTGVALNNAQGMGSLQVVEVVNRNKNVCFQTN